MEHTEREGRERRGFRRMIWVAWMYTLFAGNLFIESMHTNVRIMWREIDAFFGAALFLIGFFGFDSGRYCDGNTAEYLSCTRPSAFYYYDALHIIFIVIGVFYIFLWFQKNRKGAQHD